jgi:hypothetical protein
LIEKSIKIISDNLSTIKISYWQTEKSMKIRFWSTIQIDNRSQKVKYCYLNYHNILFLSYKFCSNNCLLIYDSIKLKVYLFILYIYIYLLEALHANSCLNMIYKYNITKQYILNKYKWTYFIYSINIIKYTVKFGKIIYINYI